MKDKLLTAKSLTNLNYSVYIDGNNRISYYMFYVPMTLKGNWKIDMLSTIKSIVKYNEYNCESYERVFDDGSLLYRLTFEDESELNRYILEVI